jgi:hypothetical protein
MASEDQKEFIFRSAPHPLLPRNLDSSDLYLFGPIEWKLVGSEFGSAEELVSEVTDVASFIIYLTLAPVFRKWEQRLYKCIDIERDYVD